MNSRVLRALLVCGVAAGPLFTAAYLVNGAARADYDMVRHPVSSLALGDRGWTQAATFIVVSLLTLAFAAGLRRTFPGSTWGPVLVGVWATGLLGAGLFTTDPVSGYPSGTPDRLADPTTEGTLHDALSMAAFVGLFAACLVFARAFARAGERGWALYSVATALVFAAAIVLSSAAFSQAGGLVEIGGLLQRAALTSAWAWITLLAVRQLRSVTGPREARPQE